ncbi:hypothetical protein [Winogradskyella luteola]|uniref:STAS/SEC14 domain-containing protein n=1 Tax=Winogradskyella luteola TaxID=2828330 RepID=A0A9X1FBQ1_9FLAO|nr:hypothetical protein [Winogradskyella luteola]MBV7270178.1 hypothetical protein [Winogradskyella luteola]
MGFFHYYDIGHAEVFVFDDFLIKQVKQGETVDMEETKLFKLILEEHFSNKNMAYISNRVTSYSVNPLVYKESEKISNLVAIAIIPATPKMRSSAKYESQFYNKPFGIFDNLSEAIKWVHKIIEKENSKKTIPSN